MYETCPGSRHFIFLGASAIIVLGVFFRVTHLATKVYWHDEVYTSLWLSGFDPTRNAMEFLDGREVSVSELLDYQRVHPARGLSQTIRTLGSNDPQHPPLYYTLAWLCARWLQDSTTVLRAVAGLFGVLLLPAMAWLCAEAFGNRHAGWLGMVLVAVSPVHILYSQEAREYSLWSLMIVVTSAALLRAMRFATGRAWGYFGLCMLLGLYSHGLFPLVMFAHAVCIVAIAAKREWHGDASGRYLMGVYLAVSFVALVLFTPWAWLVYRRLAWVVECTSWMGESSASGSHVCLWVNNLASVFVDGNFDSYDLWGSALGVFRGLTVALGLGSFLFTWPRPHRRAWLLAGALIVLPLVVLGGPDLMWGGQRSTQGRFLFPCYIGVTLALVHLLMTWLDSADGRIRLVGTITLAFLLTLSLVTSATIWRADYWWNKGNGWDDQLQAIHTINESERPLILSGPLHGASIGHTLAFSHLLDSRVRLRVIKESEPMTIPPGVTDVFLVNVSDAFVQRMGAQVRLERMAPRSQFWRWAN